jgi:hypothetical protein
LLFFTLGSAIGLATLSVLLTDDHSAGPALAGADLHDVQTLSFTGPTGALGGQQAKFTAALRNNGTVAESLQIGFSANPAAGSSTAIGIAPSDMPPGASVALSRVDASNVAYIVYAVPLAPGAEDTIGLNFTFPPGFVSASVGLDTCHADDVVDEEHRGFYYVPYPCTGTADGAVDANPANDEGGKIIVVEGGETPTAPPPSPTVTLTPPATPSPTPGGRLEETVSTTVPAGGTATTDTEGDGATAGDPVETSLTSPNAGTVTIHETTTGAGDQPAGCRSNALAATCLDLFGQEIAVTAPGATTGNPLEMIIVLDATLLPAGETASGVQVFLDGARAARCTSSTRAAPDPCVKRRTQLLGGDAEIVVLTTEGGTAGTGLPAFFGDVDCNGRIESTDALLILQFAAAITRELSCRPQGNVDRDGQGRINSVDAALVLQIVLQVADRNLKPVVH